MSEESFLDNIKINTVEENEKEVLKKIGRYDKELQSKTFQNIRRHDELIVHIRTNLYGNRKVVQAQFRTLGCRMKKLGSCWNCNYGVADECLITPNQYIKAFKREIKKQQGDVLVLESLGSITDPKEFNRNILKISRTLTTDKNDKVCIGKTTKTYAGKRDLPIPDFILPYILEQLEISKDNKDNMLFLTPNKKLVLHSTINNQLKNIAKKVDITHPISTHTLRHTYGTRCIESGMRAVALQRLLGHTDINVTLNTYTSVLNKYKEKEMEKLNDYYLSNDIFNKSRELSTINYKLLDDNNDLTR